VEPFLILFAVDILLVAPLAAWVADQRGRSPSAWFVLAAITGPIALFAVGVAPPRWVVEETRRRTSRCPACETLVPPNASRCPACQADLTTPVAEAAAIPVAEAAAMSGIVDAEPANIETLIARREMDAATVEDDDPAAISEGRGVTNLATAVFAGGSTALTVGYRYLISVSARTLRISGPVGVAPLRIVFRAPRATIESAAAQDDIAIGAEPKPGRKVQLLFRSVAGMTAEELMTRLDGDHMPVPARGRPRSLVNP
jgi:hypothetical protein